MKKIVAGVGFLITGFLSIILMSCLTVISAGTISNKYAFLYSISMYGLTPLFIIAVIFAVCGLGLIICGLITKEK